MSRSPLHPLAAHPAVDTEPSVVSTAVTGTAVPAGTPVTSNASAASTHAPHMHPGWLIWIQPESRSYATWYVSMYVPPLKTFVTVESNRAAPSVTVPLFCMLAWLFGQGGAAAVASRAHAMRPSARSRS